MKPHRMKIHYNVAAFLALTLLAATLFPASAMAASHSDSQPGVPLSSLVGVEADASSIAAEASDAQALQHAAVSAAGEVPSQAKFRRTVRRLLVLELIRLLVLQRSGLDLSVLGSDFWVQLYVRVIARGLDAQFKYDAATGAMSLIKGALRIDIRPGPGYVTVSSGGLNVMIPGELSTGAASAFWQVSEMIRSMMQVQNYLPPLPAPIR